MKRLEPFAIAARAPRPKQRAERAPAERSLASQAERAPAALALGWLARDEHARAPRTLTQSARAERADAIPTLASLARAEATCAARTLAWPSRAERPGATRTLASLPRRAGARTLVWLALALLLLSRSGAFGVQASDEWKRVEAPLELVFPRDHGAHPEYQFEWWYLTGNVATAAGRDFGFQLTFFRSGRDPRPPAPGASPYRARQVLAAHLAICDVEAGRFEHAERLRREGAGLAFASRERLEVALEDWSLERREDGRMLARASDPATGIGLELELEASAPPVLHGEGGVSAKGGGPGNASAYVSWPRLPVRGALTSGGERHEVTGLAWFDHEFGSSVLPEGVEGWDWFGLQLDDGSALMLFELRGAPRADGPRVAAGTFVDPAGGSRALADGDFTIEPVRHWTSPRTAARYPVAWRVRVGPFALDLFLAARVEDCELDSTRSTGVVYWEGPVAITGGPGGRGYAEMTGYAGTMEGRF